MRKMESEGAEEEEENNKSFVLFSFLFFFPRKFMDYIQQEARCTTGRRWVREMTLLHPISMILEEEGEEWEAGGGEDG